MINKVILEGRLTKDPEIRYTNNQKAVASWTIALNRGKDKNGNELGTDFINCVTWDKQAEYLKNWFHKGDPISVIGRLQSRTWDNNGVKQFATEVVTEKLQFTESRKSESTDRYVENDVAPSFNIDSDDLPF